MKLESDLIAPGTPASAPFLAHLSPNDRNRLTQSLLKPLRAGLTDPAEVLAVALADMRGRKSVAEAMKYVACIRHVENNPDLADAYVLYLMDRERLPHDVRQAQRVEQKAEHIAQWRETMPPTGPQIAYLKALGCRIVPLNRAEASELIARFKARRYMKGGLAVR